MADDVAITSGWDCHARLAGGAATFKRVLAGPRNDKVRRGSVAFVSQKGREFYKSARQAKTS